VLALAACGGMSLESVYAEAVRAQEQRESENAKAERATREAEVRQAVAEARAERVAAEAKAEARGVQTETKKAQADKQIAAEQAEAASKELVAKAEAASKELVAKAEGQAKALRAKAEAEAAEATKEASSLEAQLPGLEAKVDKLEKPATAADKRGGQLAGAKEACDGRAADGLGRCTDNCSAAKTQCKRGKYDRPYALQQCDNAEDSCASSCRASAERACAGIAAQLAKASEPIAEYNAAVAELANTKSRAQAARQRAANALSVARVATLGGALPAETCSGDRFFVLEKGAPGDDGTGLVVDATTGLVWARTSPGGKNHTDAESYCKGRGMRLPTESEALAITPWNQCGWPERWYTWTSTEAGPVRWWGVSAGGDSFDYYYFGDGGSLCVR